MLIIGLTGKKGCGKSTAAAEISKQGPGELGFARASFSEPLKDMVETLLFALGIDDMYTRDKESTIPRIGGSLRHLYQTLGTEWGRNLIHPGLWVTAMDSSIKYHYQGRNIIIDDVRFENEADYIRRQGGIIVHIERNGLISTDNHPSENGIAFQDGDIKLVNGNLDDFLHQFRCLAENLVTIKSTDFVREHPGAANPGATNLGLSLPKTVRPEPAEGQPHAQ
jgi:hypothetical protein